MCEIRDVTVNQSDIESVWREAWIEAPNGASTFYEAITAKWTAARAINAGGSLSNIGKNSSSHGYAQPSPDHRTTVQIERICLAALKLFEQIQADLGSADEAAIYAEGLARFAVVASETFHDFSCARAALA